MLENNDNLLAFAALDFKLSSSSKVKVKKKKALPTSSTFSSGVEVSQLQNSETSPRMPQKISTIESRSEHIPKPGPVGEGREFVSLPNILTSGIPCLGKIPRECFPPLLNVTLRV